MSGWMPAILICLLGLAATGFWFGVSRRRKAESEFGIQALASLKWRDGVAVLLEALQREGYRLPAGAAVGSTQFLLEQGSDRVLLDYKHGTTYKLGDASVREFAGAVRLRGAERGILATLGNCEPAALSAATEEGVVLVDGLQLWPRVRPFLNDQLTAQVDHQAGAAGRKGLWAGIAGSVLAGAAVFAAGGALRAPTSPPAPIAPAEATPVLRPAAPASPADEAVLRQLNATAAALAEIARLTPEQLARRRADAAKQVGRIAQVESAVWSAQRTLLLSLHRTDGKDKLLVEEACQILVQHEEMRYTRIQLNPPADSSQAVRWRLCE